MEHAKDIGLGAVGTVGVISLGQFNQLLACGAGVLTIAILGLRLAREWRNRKQPPTD